MENTPETPTTATLPQTVGWLAGLGLLLAAMVKISWVGTVVDFLFTWSATTTPKNDKASTWISSLLWCGGAIALGTLVTWDGGALMSSLLGFLLGR